MATLAQRPCRMAILAQRPCRMAILAQGLCRMAILAQGNRSQGFGHKAIGRKATLAQGNIGIRQLWHKATLAQDMMICVNSFPGPTLPFRPVPRMRSGNETRAIDFSC